MSERSAVQNPMLRYARQIGWEYVDPEEALRLREGESGLYFNEVLQAQLFRLNPNRLDAVRAADVMRRLLLLKPTIEGNANALRWLRGEGSAFIPEEKRERNIKLIDFEKIENNVFQVTDEWRHKGARFNNRADVVFLINGIPVAICETKAAAKRDGLAEGVQQIRRYHNETPEMLTAPQVFEVTELLGFFYGPTWNASRKNLFNWKDEVEGDYERKVKAFFDRERFSKLLRDYIIFLSKDDELTKVILRQHQTRAVEKVIERVYEPTKRRGLIWHTQGSGKTLTMITIASKLLRGSESRLQAAELTEEQSRLKSGLKTEKPTVLMLVDELPNAIHELGPDELAVLKQSDASDTTKILNLRKILGVKVREESGSKPFLLSIGERAEALAQAYEDRQIDTKQALEAFEQLALECAEAERERKRLNIDENSFAIYSTLKTYVETITAEQATGLNELFKNFPDYRWSQEQASQLRTELYKVLRTLVGPKHMIEVANNLLKLQRV